MNRTTPYSTDHIDYLQRNFLNQQSLSRHSGLFRTHGNEDVALLHVRGLRRSWHDNDKQLTNLDQLMEAFCSGLYEVDTPLIFLILGLENRIDVYTGSFINNKSTNRNLSSNIQIVSNNLKSAFPGVILGNVSEREMNDIRQSMRQFRKCSLITGTPTNKTGSNSFSQIDQITRGMLGHRWGYMVVAEPLLREKGIDLYNTCLGELTAVERDQSSATRHPIAVVYIDLIKQYLHRYATAKAIGLWFVTAYCFGIDDLTHLHTRTLIQSAFSGAESFPDPLRIIDFSQHLEQIIQFGQLELQCQQKNPGKIQHLYHYASVLHSGELATLVHVPSNEVPGYVMQDYAQFGIDPTDVSDDKQISVGNILNLGADTRNDYRIALDRLTEHGMIAGVTGSGKTHTSFHLLTNVWKYGIPFLVIEPAKAEYRRLLQRPEFQSTLQVFTLGDERISPFRLNPFQVLEGVSVQTHIDHLKSVFNASFAMYGPMPHILEQCIHEIYLDRGWDLSTGINRRGTHPLSYPTLTDLYHKIDTVVDKLDYGSRITPELKAALKVRINSLRIGGKGLMLDTSISIPLKTIFDRPTVLELQAIGDDDEKAFVIGLIWIFLYEYRQTNRPSAHNQLTHLTLIEEAHRILTNVTVVTNPEIANVRGKAVETFSQMLSEIRAYGEGILITDQIPTRLVPDAIKNTSLKIVHRIIAEEDRLAMRGAMNLDDMQARHLSNLGKGEVVVYTEGDDNAFLVKIPLASAHTGSLLDDTSIRQHMAQIRSKGIYSINIDCPACEGSCRHRELAQQVVDQSDVRQTFSRYVLSCVHCKDNNYYQTGLNDVIASIRQYTPYSQTNTHSSLILCVLRLLTIDHFRSIGDAYQWKHQDVFQLQHLFLDHVYSLIQSTGNVVNLAQFQARYRELCLRTFDPFPECSTICPDRTCLYRFYLKPLARQLHEQYMQAFKSGVDVSKMDRAAQEAVRNILDTTICVKEDRTRASACFLIQKAYTLKGVDRYWRTQVARLGIESVFRRNNDEHK